MHPCTRTHTSTHIYIHAHTHIASHASMHARPHTHPRTHTHPHSLTCIHARTHTHTHTHTLSRDTCVQPCAAETEFHPKLFSELPRDEVFLFRAPLWSPGTRHGGKVCLGLRQVVPSFRGEDDPHLFSAPVLTPQPTECKSWVPPDPRGIHAPIIVQREERFGQAGDGCS